MLYSLRPSFVCSVVASEVTCSSWTVEDGLSRISQLFTRRWQAARFLDDLDEDRLSEIVRSCLVNEWGHSGPKVTVTPPRIVFCPRPSKKEDIRSDERCRIDSLAVDDDLEMKVASGGISR